MRVASWAKKFWSIGIYSASLVTVGSALSLVCTVDLAAAPANLNDKPDPLQSIYGAGEIPGEIIDLRSREVTWEITDLVVPGPAGLDLVIARSWRGDSKSTDMGGWTLSVPRITFETTPLPFLQGQYTDGGAGVCSDPRVAGTYFVGDNVHHGSEYTGPIRLLIAGMSPQILTKRDPNNTAYPSDAAYVTSANWIAKCQGSGPSQYFLVVAPNGTKYTFNKLYRREHGDLLFGSQGGLVAYAATRIEDVYGNYITFSYEDQTRQASGGTSSQVDIISRVTVIATSDGRTVTFTPRPSSIAYEKFTFEGREYRFEYHPTDSYLQYVRLPEGLYWQYAHEGPRPGYLRLRKALSKVVMPSGATIDYFYCCGSDTDRNYKLERRVLSGPDMETSTVTYMSTSTNDEEVTTVTSAHRVDELTFFRGIAYKFLAPPDLLRESRLKRHIIKNPGTLTKVRQTDYVYAESSRFGHVDPNESSLLPWTPPAARRHIVITDQTVFAYDGASNAWRTYTTAYRNHDAYGNALTVSETGTATRETRYTFFTNLTNWVNGLPDTTEVVGETGILDNDYKATGALEKACKFGVCTSFDYYANGDLLKRRWMKGGAELAIEYQNYFRGRPRLEIHPEGVTIEREINPTGTLAWIKDGRGFKTSYGYDGLNRLASITPPAHAGTVITRPSARRVVMTRGNLQRAVNLDGLWREILQSQRDTSLSSPGIYTRQQFDAAGRRVFRSVPSQSSTETIGLQYSYDALDRKQSAVNTADGSNVTFCYSAACATAAGLTLTNGELVTDERGYRTLREFRSFGDPSGRELMGVKQQVRKPSEIGGLKYIDTTMSRDLHGNLRTITQGGKTREYIYNANKRVWKVIQPETGTTEFGYDEPGNKTSSKTGASGTTIFSYDGRNRLTGIDYPGATPDVTGHYYKNDQLQDIANAEARWDYDYNELDQIKSEILTISSMVFPVTYQYSNVDALRLVNYPGATSIDLDPDALGRARRVGNYASNIQYHPSGELDLIAYSNGLTEKIDLDARLYPDRTRLDRWGHTPRLLDLDYQFDSSGNLTNVVDALVGHNSRTLGYDGMDRLTSAQGPWGQGSFVYDDLGNIATQTLGAQTFSYLYSPTTGLLSSVSGAASYTLSYDVYGNVGDNGLYSFSYNDASQLTSLPSLPGTSYGYDGNGRRVRATVDGVTTYYFYNKSGLLLFSSRNSGGKATEYVYLGKRLVVSRQYGNEVTPDTDGDGMPDTFELQNGLSVAQNDASADADGDGATNLLEYQTGTGVLVADTDADGLPDGWELRYGAMNPFFNDSSIDWDQDGLSALQEYQKRTDPNDVDTDNDGIPDGQDSAPRFNPAIIGIINELLLN
jgi:hypothetical protein